jgi:cold shock CspA family protein
MSVRSFVHVHEVESAGMKTLVKGQLLTYNTAPRAMVA